jgi:carboxypeptidase Taq
LRERELNLSSDLARGDAGPAIRWLRENLQRHGSLREPRDTIRHAIGGEPSEGPLLDYLEAKFGELYGL